MKAKVPYIIIGLLLTLLSGGWFYWTQYRPNEIRKRCYSETYRKNEFNFEYADGKNWPYLTAFASGPHGWVYPDDEIERATIYNAAELFKKDKYDEKAIINQTLEKIKRGRDEVYQMCQQREGLK